MMKKWLLLPFVFSSLSAFSQASIAYYPWNDLFTVSTNPSRAVWLDLRFQTNTFFGQLNTTLAPLINVKRAPQYQIYIGPSVEFSVINAALGNDLLQNYAFQVGTRISPFVAVPNFQIGFELAPTVSSDFESGVFRSRLGLVYHFNH